MSIDVLYLIYNRLAFTEASLTLLARNTNWDRVHKLYVYDDGSTDGTRQWVEQNLDRLIPDVRKEIRFLGFGSPVAVMKHFTDDAGQAEWFAKIDNDIAVPPLWLDAMAATVEAHPEIDLLGMEATQTGEYPDDSLAVHDVEPCSWIGGVGLMRTQVFRQPLNPKGRFGFTEWQLTYPKVQRAWIKPDLRVPQLDRIPEEPWMTMSRLYIDNGWQRAWPLYNLGDHRLYYEWVKEALA